MVPNEGLTGASYLCIHVFVYEVPTDKWGCKRTAVCYFEHKSGWGEGGKKGLESIITASGLLMAAQHHSSYCHPLPFNSSIQLCYCFDVFVISSSEYQYLYSLLNSKSCPNKWLEFWRTPGDITDWDLGIIWMKQILIQQLLYHTSSLLSMCSCFEQAVMDVLPATHVLLKNHNWTWHTAQ